MLILTTSGRRSIMRLCLISLTILLSLVTAQQASAALIQGDFRTESDLPYCCASGGPLVYEKLGASIGTGEELTSADFISNPSFWGGGVVHMDIDPLTNILTLISQDDWDFETFVAQITNIQFSTSETITGLSLITNDLTTPTFIPTLTFTANSVVINYDNGSFNAGGGFDFTGGTATFQLQTSLTSVPEPGSLALLGLGVSGLAFVRRRKAVAC